ncbi:MAG: hypothetical protein H5U22_14755 [Rhizobium sp.]|nr:hypothetical protein [Rhizobium sp.]
MDRTASPMETLETICRSSGAEAAEPCATAVKGRGGSGAATHATEAVPSGALFKSLEAGCFLAGRWLA